MIGLCGSGGFWESERNGVLRPFLIVRVNWNKFELNELAYPVICKSEKRNLSLTSCFGNLVLPWPVILRLF